MRNSEKELFEYWGQDHPCERLLEIGEDSVHRQYRIALIFRGSKFSRIAVF